MNKKRYKPGDTKVVNGEKLYFERYIGYKKLDGSQSGRWKDWDSFLETRIKQSIRKYKRRDNDFNLDLKYLKAIYPKDSKCPVSLEKMKFGNTDRRNSPSLDRLDNSRGYVEGNVAWVCDRINLLKGDLTLVQLKALLNYIDQGER